MPYKAEKIKIEGTLFDKRRKLSEDDKKAIQMSRIKLKQSFIENSINNLEINQDPDRTTYVLVIGSEQMLQLLE